MKFKKKTVGICLKFKRIKVIYHFGIGRNNLLGNFCLPKIFFANGHKLCILFPILCRLGKKGFKNIVII